jgi:hypothetical protein
MIYIDKFIIMCYNLFDECLYLPERIRKGGKCMKQWTRQPAFVLVLVISVVAAGVFVGHAVFAQGAEPAANERVEGTAGTTGQIRGLTAEQLPALQPPGMTPLYHFAGALNKDTVTPNKATVVQCTNVDDTASTQVEVQLFDYDAADVFTGTLNVAPLRTATFESIPISFYLADLILYAGTVDQGYGRILTEHSNVICTVQSIDPTTSPPSWGFDIPVYTRGFGGAYLPSILRNATP